MVALITLAGQAQVFGNDPEIKIDGLASDNVWQVIEMALLDNQLQPASFNPAEGYLYSEWLTWKTVAISNRARLYFTFKDGATLVNVVDRAYESSEGWSESIGKLSKKNYKKYVQNVADRINAILGDPAMVHKAIKTSKLVPAFNAINMVGDLEWKLEQAENNEMNRPQLQFQVTNKGSKAVDVISFGGEFESLSGVGTARIRMKWETPAADNHKLCQLPAGASTHATVEVGQGYTLKSAIGYVLQIKYEHNGSKQHFLKVYNIPLPYTYTEGD